MALRFRVDDFDYTVFVTTDSLKCFGCGEEGHVIRSCPNGAEAHRPADLPALDATPHAHDGDSKSAQNAQSDAGTTVELEEPAELQGDHLGDHLDLQSESLTRELVEQTTTRMTETVLDMGDVGVEENSLNVSIKRNNTDTKVKNDKTRAWEEFGEAMANDFRTASKRFWTTIRHLTRLYRERTARIRGPGTPYSQRVWGAGPPDTSHPLPVRSVSEFGPHCWQLVLLNEVEKVVTSCNNDEFLFLGGNFNCTENPLLDRNHPEPHMPSKSTLTKVVQARELCDMWRYFHLGQRQFTWTHSRGNQLSLASYSSTQQWWDVGKIHIKQFCLQYTLIASRDMARSMRDLEREVGALVCSRFQHIAQIDAPSPFFFGPECKNGQRRMMHSLRANNGQVLDDPIEIRQRVVMYYWDLYRMECQEQPEVEQSFLKGLPQVGEEYNRELDAPLSAEELTAALHGVAGGKGVDGLPSELYRPSGLFSVRTYCVSSGTV
ncbi:Transposon TX1 uncharacterized 149 kDa protein ORF 2 [Takifugu flavidus]|uniref:Transposon TX1 uncharacterized 149 kDa protein ORF 2 n=1 Tax=Takifugu flavidus TaxID=433684 RepID=A0A5C6PF36_9TELE|nr:Transposon TX1 uncharacterized 149 kDa protein ORF 2 [Takifugu flavidus]